MSLVLMYMKTLGYLLHSYNCLTKVIQDRWFKVSTSLSLFADIVLGIDLITDHNSSWINKMSKSFWFSKIFSVRNQFLWMFCKKILKLLIIIIFVYCLCLNKLSWPRFFWAFKTSYYTICSWINASKRATLCYLLDVSSCSWHIWISASTVLPPGFLA